jgi:hypothetical protein
MNNPSSGYVKFIQLSTINNLFLPSPLTALPVVPQAEGFKHLHTVGVAHCLLDLIVSEPWSYFLVQVRQLEA